MIFGSIYTIFSYEPLSLKDVPLIDFGGLRYLIGSMLFITFLHHSVPGLIYPVRPQTYLRATFASVFASKAVIVIIHCGLAIFAFGNRENDCSDFPCKIDVIVF